MWKGLKCWTGSRGWGCRRSVCYHPHTQSWRSSVFHLFKKLKETSLTDFRKKTILTSHLERKCRMRNPGLPVSRIAWLSWQMKNTLDPFGSSSLRVSPVGLKYDEAGASRKGNLHVSTTSQRSAAGQPPDGGWNRPLSHWRPSLLSKASSVAGSVKKSLHLISKHILKFWPSFLKVSQL